MKKTGKVSALVRKMMGTGQRGGAQEGSARAARPGRGTDARSAGAPGKAGMAARSAMAAAAVALALSPALPAEAAYTYEVRIQTGAQGRLKDGGGTVRTYTDGDGDGKVTVNFDWSDEVEVPEGSKYYVKGIRKSGTEEMATASFTVEGDADYVVAYGIRDGHQVSYTVHYEDVDGNELAGPKEGRGNIGDTPIIGHLPIDGYLPQAYNLTRTLTANEAGNVFTFVYRRMTAVGGGGTETVTEETVETGNTQTVILPGADTVVGGGGGTTIVEDGGTTAIEGGAGEAGEAGAEGGGGAAEGPQEPEELINLDDEETPLAGPGGGDGGAGGGPGSRLFGMPAAVKAGIVSAIVLLSAGIYLLIAKRKQKEGPEGKD